MPATNGHNKACCNIPPVVHYNYVPKGTYTELGGYKTCMCSLALSNAPQRLTDHLCRRHRPGGGRKRHCLDL